jgi:hypothetical protein
LLVSVCWRRVCSAVSRPILELARTAVQITSAGDYSIRVAPIRTTSWALYGRSIK